MKTKYLKDYNITAEPCPFCGTKNRLEFVQENGKRWVRCAKCLCCGPPVPKAVSVAANITAVETWNERP